MKRKNNLTIEESTANDTAVDFFSLMGDVSPIKTRNQATHSINKPSVIPKFSNTKGTIANSEAPKQPASVFSEYQASVPLKQINTAAAHKKWLLGTTSHSPSPPQPTQSEFAKTIGATTPIDTKNKKWIEPPKPKPYVKTQSTSSEPIGSLPSDHAPWSGDGSDNDELVFLRPALEKNILKKLRQGEWPVQASLDFHGNSLDTARERFMTFMQQVENAQLRCIRLVHGKGLGSKNGQPIIKQTLRAWLIQQKSVLAFCPQKNEQGGAGSTLVLLRQIKQQN